VFASANAAILERGPAHEKAAAWRGRGSTNEARGFGHPWTAPSVQSKQPGGYPYPPGVADVTDQSGASVNRLLWTLIGTETGSVGRAARLDQPSPSWDEPSASAVGGEIRSLITSAVSAGYLVDQYVARPRYHVLRRGSRSKQRHRRAARYCFLTHALQLGPAARRASHWVTHGIAINTSGLREQAKCLQPVAL
jgi:hypothetical protein